MQIEVDVSFGLPSLHDGWTARYDRARESRPRAAGHSQFGARLPLLTGSPSTWRRPTSARRVRHSICRLHSASSQRRDNSRRRPLRTRFVLGELSLDGGINAIRGVLPIAVAARRLGLTRLLLPPQNAPEACVVDGLSVCVVRSLSDALDALRSPDAAVPTTAAVPQMAATPCDGDLADVRGQLLARRALEVAAAGGHNLLLIGPPGAGKTMLADETGGILPPLTFEEALECTAIHSVAGTLPSGSGLLTWRPFRAPHHTVSNVALVGGGAIPRPGEISLAHNGVLFLDEMPEFDRRVLEVLRQPLEEGRVTIARAARTAVFPARFVLMAAMNPCPCGFLGDERRACRCTPANIALSRAIVRTAA